MLSHLKPWLDLSPSVEDASSLILPAVAVYKEQVANEVPVSVFKPKYNV